MPENAGKTGTRSCLQDVGFGGLRVGGLASLQRRAVHLGVEGGAWGLKIAQCQLEEEKCAALGLGPAPRLF